MPRKVNPWAICHSKLGKKKTDKFERCVMNIKSKQGIKEAKKKTRCWKGYKPTPGKTPYSKGSCMKEQAEFIRNFLNEKRGKSTDDAIADFLSPQGDERGPKLTGKDLKKVRDPKTGKKVTAIDSRGYGLPLKRKDK